MADSLDLDAARLACLAAKASVSLNTPLAQDGICVHHRATIVGLELVAEELSTATKPLMCAAQVVEGVLGLSYSTLVPGSDDHRWHTQMKEVWRQHGGYMLPYLQKISSRPADALFIYCVGRDEARLIPLPAVERWSFDYYNKGTNVRGDYVENPGCVDWPDYIEAKKKGAAGILILASPQDDKSSFTATITIEKE